jgi:ADP-ribosylglycohydrolase
MKVLGIAVFSAFLFHTAVFLCGQEIDSLMLDRIEGLLIGSAIGDAAGGPVEFAVPVIRSEWCTGQKRLTPEGIRDLASAFRLRPYSKDTEPYAQWEPYGPEGTVTDDTRFKMIFFNTLKNHPEELTLENFASEVLNYRNTLKEQYRVLYDLWIPEIGYATRWVLGKRKNAYPPTRLWGGLPTMAGQMPFLCIAAVLPGDPQKAYLKTWELAYLDVGTAKDINAGLVAGLSAALQKDADWKSTEQAIRDTDPFAFGEVPWVPRSLTEWMDRAHEWVRRADRRIGVLFSIMESELKARTWWEAWVPVTVVWACVEIVEYDALAAMQLTIEFGHDTDSYAQVMGAFLGALNGKSVFPQPMRETVNRRMKQQFGQNVDDWMEWIAVSRQEYVE